jgi:hypothetical protein
MYEAGRRSDAQNGRAAAGLSYRRRGGMTADRESERESERERFC